MRLRLGLRLLLIRRVPLVAFALVLLLREHGLPADRAPRLPSSSGPLQDLGEARHVEEVPAVNFPDVRAPAAEGLEADAAHLRGVLEIRELLPRRLLEALLHLLADLALPRPLQRGLRFVRTRT